MKTMAKDEFTRKDIVDKITKANENIAVILTKVQYQEQAMTEMKDNQRRSVEEIKSDISTINQKLDNNYATKADILTLKTEFAQSVQLLRSEFTPTKNIIWSIIKSTLTFIVGGAVAWFFSNHR